MPVQRRLGGPLAYAPPPARQGGTGGASTASPLQEFQDTPPQTVTSLRGDRDPGASPGMPPSQDAVPSHGGTSLLDLLREGLASPNALAGLEPPKEAISRGESGPPRVSTGSAPAPDAGRKRKKRSREIFKGDAALKELRSRLAAAPADQTPEPPLAQRKTPIFASAMRLVVVVGVAAGGALGFLWITSPHGSRSPNLQAGKEVALVSQRETPRPAAENVAAEQRAPDPLAAAEQAAGAALYQDFLRWRQRQGR